MLDASGNLITSGGVGADAISSAGIQATDVRSFLFGWNGTTWDRVQISSGALVVTFPTVADDAVDSGNPLKVGSKGLGGALAALSASGDRADLISDLYRRVYINDSPNIAMDCQQITVGATAAQIDATPLAGRRRAILQNQSQKYIFVGPSGVTASSGIKLAPGSSLTLEIGQDVPIYAISTAAGQELRFMELA
jgi:hypothetical protein